MFFNPNISRLLQLHMVLALAVRRHTCLARGLAGWQITFRMSPIDPDPHSEGGGGIRGGKNKKRGKEIPRSRDWSRNRT